MFALFATNAEEAVGQDVDDPRVGTPLIEPEGDDWHEHSPRSVHLPNA